jgi:O-6-methylguanine DNA methyltransferase
MKLAGKSKAALLTTGLTAKEYIRRAIATHRDGVADVRKMLKESPDPATAAMSEMASRNQIDFWAACFQIPEGYVASYATLSRVVQGARGEQTEVAKLSRTAGKCMAQNPLAPVVPCHRVVGVSGALTGFKGESTCLTLGLKAALLVGEGVPVEGSGTRFTVRPQTGRLL